MKKFVTLLLAIGAAWAVCAQPANRLNLATTLDTIDIVCHDLELNTDFLGLFRMAYIFANNSEYKLTAAIFDNIDNITKEHAKGAELSLQNATDGMTAPFHAGAAKYFKEKGIEVETQ